MIYAGVFGSTLRVGLKASQKRYNICHLVYYEEYCDVREAIAREKQLKSWNRSKKCTLIESSNPGWHELSLA